MTELDFDELDKAVNSLMADVEKTSDTPEPTSATAPVSVQNSEPVVKPVPTATTAKPTSTPLATKRRGQFMDVIRPSSASNTKPANLARHQGVTLSPVNSPSASTAASSPSPEVSAPQAEIESTTPPVADEPKSEWPDPLDLATGATSSSEVAMTESPAEVNDTPLDSPFLPDAKPEKRPLGGLQREDEGVEAQESQPEKAEDVAVPASPTPPASVVLPEELHTNLVAIESESTGASQPEVSEPALATPAPAVEPEPSTPVDIPTPEPVIETPVARPQPEVPAGGAIAQQYKEEPSSGDQTNGSIYDTANYHKAIEAHATGGKKSSVLKWVMWIVLLLILGVGGGAAAFMLTR